MTPGETPEISVLVPAYNGAAWLAKTLNRLAPAAAGLSYEAIVVDNASSDATVALSGKAADVRVIRNEKNLGFSRAVNQAAAVSRGKVLVIVNQDLHLQPGALKALAEFALSKNAVVGGALAYADGAPQPSCGPFPTLLGTLWRLLLPRRIRKYYLGFAAGRPRPVDWATGAFVGFPRAAFDKIGGLDENYFMYYEDVDFCLRARAAGFPSFFLPTAQAVHVAPYSDRDEAPGWLRTEIRYSQVTYFKKHRPAWEYNAILALNRAYFALHGWPWRKLV